MLQLASFSLAEVTYATGDISYQVSLPYFSWHVFLPQEGVGQRATDEGVRTF